jgi:superfamily II DNA helicase RecQ
MTERSWKGLYEALRKLRLNIARDNKMPAWWCNNKLLQEIARRRPSTVENFLSIEGIKPRHAKFAKPIVALIKKYCCENAIETDTVRKTTQFDPEKRTLTQKRLRDTIGSLSGVDMDLYRILQDLRLMLCRGRCARSRIFHNFAIRDMARRRPSTRESFLKVYGVGEKKCEQFGDLFLQAIKDYCTAHSVQMDVEPVWE